jgi:hypothetical protein
MFVADLDEVALAALPGCEEKVLREVLAWRARTLGGCKEVII